MFLVTNENMGLCLYMVSKNLSVCQSIKNFEPNYLGTGKAEWAENFFRTSMANRNQSWFVGCKDIQIPTNSNLKLP